MATPFFEKGASTLSFPLGVQTPGNEPIRKIQATDRTAGGTLQVENLGVTTNQIILVFNGMDKSTTFAGLKNWFDNIADGALNSFTYSDHDAASYLVRITDSVLNFTEFEPGIMQGQISLEVV